MRHGILATALCLAASLSIQARAQGASSDAVSKEVVMAILRNIDGPSDALVLTDNQLPASLATRVAVPPGARILATLLGRVTQVIGTTAGNPDSVRAWFADDFERRGYRPGPTWYNYEAFRPAARSATNRPYCGDGLELSVLTRQRQPRLVEFVLRASVSESCSARPPNRFADMTTTSGSGMNPPKLPLLFHPRTAEVAPRCYQVNRGPQSTTTGLIATSMTAEQLLTHYGRQLDSAGWKRESANVVVSGEWTKRDSTGRDVRLSLSVSVGRVADCRSLSMTASELRP